MRTSRDLARLFGELGPRKVDQYSAEDIEGPGNLGDLL